MSAPGPKPPAHGMIPGSHERFGGAQCRCGAEWSVWEEICYVQFKAQEQP